ncbi:MAG: L,D-transpeptidase family protein [Bacteroidota bacterium]
MRSFSAITKYKALLLAISMLFLYMSRSSARQIYAYPTLVKQFYSLNSNQRFWFNSNPFSSMIRTRFLQVLDTASYHGLDKERYHYSELAGHISEADTNEQAKLDRLFTDGIIAYSKDMYQGGKITSLLSNDEVSPKHVAADDDYILTRLVTVTSLPAVEAYNNAMMRREQEILTLEQEYARQVAANNTKQAEQLKISLGMYRWLKHFNFERYILVNIPSATLRYYEGNEVKLEMKVVVGKPTTKTPRFSSYCKEVILYPYWNVPRSIVTKELFPKFKKNPAALNDMNMQVVDVKGRVLDENSIDWSAYDKFDFPYGFRQYTGCDNALGVIKFNLTDPFDVYLHDTNNKLAFKKDARFLSHGCIRVEKPVELANILLNNQVDEGMIRACIKDQSPIWKKVGKAVPVFVLYMPADVSADSVKYHKDIYKLL